MREKQFSYETVRFISKKKKNILYVKNKTSKLAIRFLQDNICQE